MADQDKKQALTDHQTKAKQTLRGITSKLTAFCAKNQVIEFNYASMQLEDYCDLSGGVLQT